MTDKDRINQLCYALGLAIGGLEAIRSYPYDINQEGLTTLLNRLKKLAETPIYFVGERKAEGGADE